MDRNDNPNPNRTDFKTYAMAGVNRVVLLASGLAFVVGSVLATVFVH